MNVETSKSPGRLAELNPFDVTETGEVFEQPPRAGKPSCNSAHKIRPLAGEYGCVDWYQYHHSAITQRPKN